MFIAALCAMRMSVSGDQGSLYNRLCTIAIVLCLQNEGFGFDPGEKCKAMWKEHGPPGGNGNARALGRGMTILAVHAAPPHTDGMKIHCSWEGFALPNPP